MEGMQIEIDLSRLYDGACRLSQLDTCLKKAKEMAEEGNDVILTGRAPIWLYLKVAHELHEIAKKLFYRSPVLGSILIFDYDPFLP